MSFISELKRRNVLRAAFAYAVVFWLLAALIVHHHVIYPVVVRFAAARKLRSGGEHSKASSKIARDENLPLVSVIVPAHNEALYLAQKVRNLVEIDYPADRLRIVIALDGCTDGSGEVALKAAAEIAPERDIEIVSYAENVGKLAVLNGQIDRVQTPIVALSDTSALIPPDAIRRATARFDDQRTGFVAAGYRIMDTASDGERAYNAYLTRVRRDEALLDSPLGVHGSLYFFRRSLWRPLPASTINDDFVLPMMIAELGYRGIYDEAILSLELERTASGQEFRRRVRIGAGNMQQSIWLWRLADPRRPWLAFMFVSGKGMRPLIPIMAITAALLAMVLAGHGHALYGWLLGAGLAAVATGLAAARIDPRHLPRPLAWLAYLMEGHAASFIGALKFLCGQRISYWQAGGASVPRYDVLWRSATAERRTAIEGV